MSIYDITPFDFSKTRSYPLTGRSSKVTFKNLASTHTPQSTFSTWLDRLPDILAARDLKRLAKLVVEARHLGRASIVGMGGHVIKCGLAPVIIDLIDQGFITAVAMNGSAAIHDFEMGLVGMTSEDVDFSLGKGDF
ncbi:MAG: hypothetical protein JNN15_19420, partial [Blastocatellia bacterium]|nr:hypothetical protein [Blastocatellia bacterium]